MKGPEAASTQVLRRVVRHGNFIPQLDGLRFIAITSVVLFHANGRLAQRHGLDAPHLSDLLRTGWFGVELFFAISGFILAYQFWRNSGFTYRTYIRRRIRRIEPPFIIAMVLQLAMALALGDKSAPDYLASFAQQITYTSNIFGANIINGVTWSLEIEVQFYLVLPLLLTIASRVSVTGSPLRPLALLITLNAVCYLLSSTLEIKTLAQFLPFFSVGVATAWLKVFSPDIQVAKLNEWTTGALIFALFGLGQLAAHPTPVFLIRLFIMLILFVSILIHDSGTRALKAPWVVTIGGMCYSIYLWHMVAIAFADRALAHFASASPDAPIVTYGLAMASMVTLTLALSVPAFLLAEKPFMLQHWSWSFLRNKEALKS